MINHYTEIDITEDEKKPQIAKVCNDCGAFSIKPKEVKHYNSCKPGESKKWEEHYAKTQ